MLPTLESLLAVEMMNVSNCIFQLRKYRRGVKGGKTLVPSL